MQLYVVRNQQSVDNINRIIQGPEHNSPLTMQGQQDAQKLADSIYGKLSGKTVNHVVSSPLERAAQTAQIVADRLGVPVVYDDSLVEFDPGVLAGPKTRARQLDPKYLEIYHKRGDLDGIEDAEKGDNLQARAIYFLERYIDSDKGLADVVVSHAGYNRSMVNTARSNPRTQPIGHQHDQIHIIEDPWQTMEVIRLRHARASQASKIKTQDQKYVMKRIFGASEKEMQFQYKIAAHVAQGGKLLSEVLYWGMRPGHAVQVLNFLEGDHIYEELTDRQRKNLFTVAYELGQRLQSAPDNIRESYDHTLKEIIEDCLDGLDDSPIRRVGLKLLENPRNSYLVSKAPQVLVHYDLHRQNILFREDDSVRLLDLGSMVYAPKAFLPASLFMSSFMLQQGDNFSLPYLISEWPEKLDLHDMAILVLARAVIGGAFFQKIVQQENPKPRDMELFEKYSRSIEHLENMIGDIK